MNQIISKDGTPIIYTKTGEGPAVILIDGAFCNKDFGPMPKIVPLLAKNYTVYSYDRRARGQSGDTSPYAIERELEDLEALVKLAGKPVYFFAVSSGAILALLACSYGISITKLALLEPPFVGNKNKPADAVEKLQGFISEGRDGAAIRYYMTKLMGVPAIVPFVLRFTSNWKKMKANAKSLPYDAIICGDFRIPNALLAKIQIQTIVIDSTKSPAILRDAAKEVALALPHGKNVSLKGTIHDVPANILVPVLQEFFQ